MVTRKMRVLAASLTLVMCVSLYSVPKSKAVVAETAAVAVGSAVLATCLVSFGMSIQTDSGDTVGEVISSLVGDYLEYMAFDTTPDGWLSEIANNTELVSPGLLLLCNLAKMDLAGFINWLTETFELDEDGKEATVLPGTSDMYLYNGVELTDIDPVWIDKETYPYAAITNSNGSIRLYISGDPFTGSSDKLHYTKSTQYSRYTSDSSSWGSLKDVSYAASYYATVLWSNYDILDSEGVLTVPATTPVPVGDVTGQWGLTRGAGFSNLAASAQDGDSLTFHTGLLSETLEEFAAAAPWAIAEGTYAPTAELTQTGEGTDTETQPDEETGIYIPVLSDIKTRLDTLGDSIVDGIMSGLKSLVVPDEAFFAEAVPALQETFQGRMGLLTFPISLLADFLGRLLDLSDQEPILRWNSVSIYGTELIAAGQYNFKDALKSASVKQMHDIYMIAVNATLIFAFLGLCQNKYRKIMQN